jgi:nucleoside-triphosphatase THEP1
MNDIGKRLIWRKAAVLGSLWAASEIVLGGFLHNARIPLRGHILTGIGIAILVAGHRLWPQRGLLWRAGLICAAMKAVSPSAVILAPMLAISMEGLLLEIGVLLAGINPVGYILGGALAMSWPLFHTLAGLFLFYGPETLAVYSRAFDRLRTWTGLLSDPLRPFLAIWAGHALIGAVAAAIGLRVSRVDVLDRPATLGAAAPFPRPAARSRSLVALVAHVLFLMGILSLGSRLGFWPYASVCAGYAVICGARYARAAAIIQRISLWLGVLIVGVLAGAVLGRWQAGALMGFRAVVLTLGFSCVGEELMNPALRRPVERLVGQAFFDSLELAFLALPGVFAGLPSASRFLRHPAASLAGAIERAPVLLDALAPGRVFFLTGDSGAGKSTLALELARQLKRLGVSVAGLAAPGLWDSGVRAGFDLIDLSREESRPLCRRVGPSTWPQAGPFRFSPEAVAFGLRALAEGEDADVLIIDEIGPLELGGRGWAEALDRLSRKRRKPMIWVVRPALLDAVSARWDLTVDGIWKPGQDAARYMADLGVAPRETRGGGNEGIGIVGAQGGARRKDQLRTTFTPGPGN